MVSFAVFGENMETTRRGFVLSSAGAVAFAAAQAFPGKDGPMNKIELERLPYAEAQKGLIGG